MFDSGCSSEITLPDPESVGIAHVRLAPLGFERRMWHVFGECFAEVMFDQECIRAFPHAPSAWSLLSIAMTDKINHSRNNHGPLLWLKHLLQTERKF
ncbi:hypothetical protein GCK32_003599 [Trichostrongylus colubriformis]|uniref:Uncharacterized protein n=1 Tax=Trichostrongylus colubriformis TaxID=6319 RepID=A0AAN8F9R7_TRICO